MADRLLVIQLGLVGGVGYCGCVSYCAVWRAGVAEERLCQDIEVGAECQVLIT